MGQKVNPIIFRLGINKFWNSIWYSDKKKFLDNLRNDYLIRNFINIYLHKVPISNIIIERLSSNIIINIYTSKPGIIIGKKGEDLIKLKNKISGISKIETLIKVFEVKNPELDAKLISENISFQIKKKKSFRKVIKRYIQQSMKYGALGIKIKISGRLGGSDIARSEWYKEGRIPLHTIRSNIDYNCSICKTTYGIIGIKVWVFKGMIF
ncbi:30S ribosomal protein S3 [endosymbiont of Euscepes postfasciatus]|uniref:30S ribosomal protein S3 n=1 Tax=endosymbiont of Euscepes postfasciatus TaxID=650377 RepID=UPI000DC726F2|nr:30S ribosomal protein S3 [endosymbiont of Euscepes postfasciatus]BBA84687.1 30S ribosomal protein S3 [endosymbiont of Euscepes postfasciatus]